MTILVVATFCLGPLRENNSIRPMVTPAIMGPTIGMAAVAQSDPARDAASRLESIMAGADWAIAWVRSGPEDVVIPNPLNPPHPVARCDKSNGFANAAWGGVPGSPSNRFQAWDAISIWSPRI